MLEAEADVAAVLATINRRISTATSPGGRPLQPVSYILGGVELDDDGNIVSAQALRWEVLLHNNVADISGDVDKDPVATKWELKFTDRVLDVDSAVIDVFPLSLGFTEEENAGAIFGDASLLPVGCAILVVYAMAVLHKSNAVESRSMLAVACVLGVVFSTAGAFGLVAALGVQFSFVVQAALLLLLGLGMDDCFVIVSAFDHEPRTLPIRERLARAMSKAGTVRNPKAGPWGDVGWRSPLTASLSPTVHHCHEHHRLLCLPERRVHGPPCHPGFCSVRYRWRTFRLCGADYVLCGRRGRGRAASA